MIMSGENLQIGGFYQLCYGEDESVKNTSSDKLELSNTPTGQFLLEKLNDDKTTPTNSDENFSNCQGNVSQFSFPDMTIEIDPGINLICVTPKSAENDNLFDAAYDSTLLSKKKSCSSEIGSNAFMHKSSTGQRNFDDAKKIIAENLHERSLTLNGRQSFLNIFQQRIQSGKSESLESLKHTPSASFNFKLRKSKSLPNYKSVKQRKNPFVNALSCNPGTGLEDPSPFVRTVYQYLDDNNEIFFGGGSNELFPPVYTCGKMNTLQRKKKSKHNYRKHQSLTQTITRDSMNIEFSVERKISDESNTVISVLASLRRDKYEDCFLRSQEKKNFDEFCEKVKTKHVERKLDESQLTLNERFNSLQRNPSKPGLKPKHISSSSDLENKRCNNNDNVDGSKSSVKIESGKLAENLANLDLILEPDENLCHVDVDLTKISGCTTQLNNVDSNTCSDSKIESCSHYVSSVNNRTGTVNIDHSSDRHAFPDKRKSKTNKFINKIKSKYKRSDSDNFEYWQGTFDGEKSSLTGSEVGGMQPSKDSSKGGQKQRRGSWRKRNDNSSKQQAAASGVNKGSKVSVIKSLFEAKNEVDGKPKKVKNSKKKSPQKLVFDFDTVKSKPTKSPSPNLYRKKSFSPNILRHISILSALSPTRTRKEKCTLVRAHTDQVKRRSATINTARDYKSYSDRWKSLDFLLSNLNDSFSDPIFLQEIVKTKVSPLVDNKPDISENGLDQEDSLNRASHIDVDEANKQIVVNVPFPLLPHPIKSVPPSSKVNPCSNTNSKPPATLHDILPVKSVEQEVFTVWHTAGEFSLQETVASATVSNASKVITASPKVNLNKPSLRVSALDSNHVVQCCNIAMVTPIIRKVYPDPIDNVVWKKAMNHVHTGEVIESGEIVLRRKPSVIWAKIKKMEVYVVFDRDFETYATLKLESFEVRRVNTHKDVEELAVDTFTKHLQMLDKEALDLSASDIKYMEIGGHKIPIGSNFDINQVRIEDSFLPCKLHLSDKSQWSISAVAYDTLISKTLLEKYLSVILAHHYVVFYGPSGTGKSYLARRFAHFVANRMKEKSLPTLITNVTVDSWKNLLDSIRNDECDYSKVYLLDGFTQSFVASGIDISEVFHLCEILQPKPFVICTLTQSFGTCIPALWQQNFRWMWLPNHDAPVDGLLQRYLRRKFVQNGNLHLQREYFRVCEWLATIWRHVNKLIEDMTSNECTIGPSMFYSCPTDVLLAEEWFADIWSYSVCPYFIHTVRQSIRRFGQRPNSWQDPLEMILKSYPWVSERKLKLKRICMDDVGYSGTCSCDGATTENQKLTDFLRQLELLMNDGNMWQLPKFISAPAN